MAPKRLALLLLPLAALAGCSRAKPAPGLDGVSPELITSFIATPAEVTGRNFFVDAEASLQGDEGSVDDRFRVRVGAFELDPGSVTRVDNEHLAVIFPAGLPAGVHDLTVITPGSDAVTLDGGLTVVDEPVGLHVGVETAPGGIGEPVGATTLTADETLTLFAVGRDDAGAFVVDVAVEWDAGALGTIDAGRSTSATFDAVQAGVGSITIENAWAGTLTGAGPITVVPGRAAVLAVEPVLLTLSADDPPVTFDVTAIDADGNATTDLGTLTWSIDSGPITAIDPTTGTFDPVTAGVGVVRVSSSHGAQETADVIVAPGQVAALEISPLTRSFTADDAAFDFDFVARDADGNVTTDVGTLTWSIASGPITAIDASTGVFTPMVAGTGTLGLASSLGPSTESGAVVVLPGAAAALTVAPDTLSLDADDAAVAFTVTGTDADGNATTNLGTITWSIASGPIAAIDASTGSFDPVTAGSGTVRATSSHPGVFDDSGTVTVDPGAAVALVVSPDTLSVDADDPATSFTVTGSDADGNATPDLGTITWSISSGPIGAIDASTGSFDPVTAGSGTVRATSSYPGVFDDSGTVTVDPGRAASLTVAPDTLVLDADDAPVSFSVTAIDADGNDTPDLGVIAWSVSTGSIAAIDASTGSFDPTDAGTGRVRATSSYGPFDDSGTITVNPGRAAVLTVDPVLLTLTADDSPVTFDVTAVDADGNATTDLGTLTWSIDSGPITAIDSTTGTFDPVTAGSGVVRVSSSHGPQETADVIVAPGQVASLEISPLSRTFTADDAAFDFDFVARDADGNVTTDVGTLSWSIASGPIAAIDASTGVFTPVVAGTGTLGLASSLGPSTESDAVVVLPGAAAALTVAPDTLLIDADDAAITFTVTGTDADGNATTNLGTITWSISSGPIGAIDASSGSFDPVTAGSGTVRATSSYPGVFDDSGTITVDPGAAVALVVSPDTLTVDADAPATPFTLTGTDADGNATPDLGTITWSISSGPISAIDASTGSFDPVTAGSGTVRATSSYSGVVDDTGTITVLPGRAATLTVAPDTLVLDADDAPVSFSVTAIDADGNDTPDLGVITWSVSTGSIATINASTGSFDPTEAGTGRVRATSSYGAFDDSGTITVEPGQATLIAVSPDTLLIDADDAPMLFTVSAIDGDGNLTADVGTLTWSIASGPISAIDPGTGSFDPVTAGTGSVLASSSYGPTDESGTITVDPGAAVALTVAPDTHSTTVGGAAQPFTVTGTDADGNATPDLGTITWSVSSGTIASIDAGTGVFTPTASGTGTLRATSDGGPFDDTGAIDVQSAAALAASFSVPATVSAGQTFGVTMTVTNSGQSGASGVAPSALVTGGTSTAMLAGGPTPVSTAIPGGTFETFSWTYTAGAAGSLDFTGSASGTDASTGNPVSSSNATSSAITVQVPASLSATISLPASIDRGATFTVTMNVTNTGGATANAVTPSALTASGTGSAAFASGPTPASLVLAGGASGSFTWTYTANADGTIAFSGSAGGTDANSGASIGSGTVSSNTGTIDSATLLVTNPFADGTAFAYVTGYAGKVFLGPSSTGGGAVSHEPDGSNPTNRAFSLPKDTTGPKVSANTAAPPFPSLGAPGCTLNSNTLPNACGPDNENARGIFTSGTFSGTQWLLAAGGKSGGGAVNYVYMTSTTGATLSFRYVDLDIFLSGGSVGGVSAVHFFGDRVYLGFPDTSGSRPYLLRLKTAPPSPGLDATTAHIDNLDADKMPGFKSAAVEILDSIADFNGRLYVANKGLCMRATIAEPRGYQGFPGDWASCTPSNAAYTAKTSRTTTKMSELEPSDKSVPQIAVYNGRLYLARNTTDGPQLWACAPGTSGDLTQCDSGDWSLVAANTTGDTQLSQFNNANNTDITMLVATPSALFVGYNNAANGVVIFRSTAASPLARADFQGQACTADNHPASCAGIAGNGLGDPANLKRIYDAKTLTFGADSSVYVTVGQTGSAVRVFKLAN